MVDCVPQNISYTRRWIQWSLDVIAISLFVIGSVFFLLGSVWLLKDTSSRGALKVNVVGAVLYLAGSIKFLLSLIFFSRPQNNPNVLSVS